MSKEKLLAAAQKNIEKGQIGKAIKDYQKLLEADPKDIRNRQKLAELLSRERMKDEALKEYETVARTYSDTGFYLKAIAVYRQMLKLEQSRPDIYQRLAELSEKQGLTGDALAEYRNLSACCEKNKLFSEQLKALQKMRELEPENLTTRIRIVETMLLIDSAENARKELQAFLDDLDPGSDSARVLKIYDHFLPKFPDDPLLSAGRAEILIRKGEKQQGMQALHDLLRKNPENSDVLRILARAYRLEGKYQEERLVYERLLVHQAGDLEFRAGYLRAGLQAGEEAAVRRDLSAWQEDFKAAGKGGLLQEILARLGSAPPEPEVLTESVAAGEDEAVALLEPEFEPEPEEVEELEEIADLLDEEEAEEETAPVVATGFGEEVSLDFLEESPLDFLEGALPEEVETVPVPEADEQPRPEPAAPAEVELELELDMELELDSDPAFEEAEAETVDETVEFADTDEDGLLDLEVEVEGELPETIDEPPEITDELSEAAEELPETGDASGEIPVAAAVKPEPADDFFDLGADIAAELDQEEVLGPVAEEERVATPAAPAKKRVKTDGEVDDPESHYNLGIAYKEMGLLDDAIGEFEKAMAAPARTVPCLILKGMCLLEKGERRKAEETLRAGLKRGDIDEEGRIGLHYELGEILEGGNQLQQALDSFQYVADRDLFYRNAGDRVAALRQRLDGDSVGGRKSRVSYV